MRAFEWRTFGHHSLAFWVLHCIDRPYDYRAAEMLAGLDAWRSEEHGIERVIDGRSIAGDLW